MEKKVIKFPDPADKDAPAFIMQDLDSGEVESADDLAAALLGPGAKDDALELREIEGKR